MPNKSKALPDSPLVLKLRLHGRMNIFVSKEIAWEEISKLNYHAGVVAEIPN